MAANNPGREMQSDKPILLLTRPEADSQRFLEELPSNVRAACEVVIAPLFQIVSTGADIPGDGEIVLSSANALPQIAPHQGRIAWCVGEKTTERVKSAGFDARFAGHSASELVQQLSEVSPRRLVHVRGTHSRGDISGRLSEAGHDMRVVVAYDQSEVDWTPDIKERLATASAIIAPVFSPRSARLLAARLPSNDVLHVVAMSSSVASGFNFLDSKHILIASDPDMDAMIASTSEMLDRVVRVEGNGRAG